MKKTVLILSCGLVALWPASVLIINNLVKLPELTTVTRVQPAEQNWPSDFSKGFYHLAQGSELLPYEWLLALEQPQVRWTLFGEMPLLLEPSYIGRFGFLPDAADPRYNPDGLPVGIARDERWTDPVTGQKRLMAGLTCAVCHTGQLEFKAADGQIQAIRIDGGPGMVDLQRFEQALGIALVMTDKVPLRFERFARRVLKEQYSEARASQLKTELTALVDKGLHEIKLNRQYKVYPHQPGYGRVDALNRIGNQVFGLEVKESNLAPANAPVAFPHLWGASWFDFVQYNGSVPQPLVRNVGEALGVRAPFVGRGDPANLYKSAVHVDNLWLMEEWLAGAAPYQGLTAPKWPSALGAIDSALAAKGAALYQQHCLSCHLPDTASLLQDRANPQPRYWTAKNFRGDPLLKLPLVPLAVIGTDPQQAQEFATRKADTGDLELGTMLAGAALDHVSTQVTQRYFADNHISDDQQLAWNNGHKLGAEGARVELAYKARPLDGVWATPPFLHNGSVPSIYDLLLPVEQRPRQFSLGSRQFDVGKLGYQTETMQAIEPFDVSLVGNSNQGHEFANKPGQAGVIGPLLTDEQRYALIEYLKTL